MIGESESKGVAAPKQSRLVDHHRINNDPRMLAAAELYQQHNNSAFLVYKTTRAGCTTGLVAESINREEQFTCLVPTNMIANDTIIADAKKKGLFDF